jgi:hypothetical protein
MKPEPRKEGAHPGALRSWRMGLLLFLPFAWVWACAETHLALHDGVGELRPHRGQLSGQMQVQVPTATESLAPATTSQILPPPPEVHDAIVAKLNHALKTLVAEQ